MQKKRLKISLLAAMLALPIAQATAANWQETVATQVLSKLYLTYGNLQTAPPKIKIDASSQKVAAFYPAKNLIVLDAKAYAVCQKLGRDSLDALAFIIGHELTHSQQTETRQQRVSTNFLAYDRSISANIRTEKVADIQGIFNAWLAGFRAREVVPRVLDDLYSAYNLKNKTLPGYPSLAERQAAVGEVAAIVENLVGLYESANYLIAIGYFDLAANALEHILQYYRGREVLNNLAVANIKYALTFPIASTDRFIYPFELDWASDLQKRRISRGDEQPLAAEESFLRWQLLDKADRCLTDALELDNDHRTAILNKSCVLLLLNRADEALRFLEIHFPATPVGKKKKSQKTRSFDDDEAVQMAFALARQMLGQRDEAAAIFEKLEKSAAPLVAMQANFNRAVATTGQPPAEASLSDFEFPPAFLLMLQAVELGDLSASEKLWLTSAGTGLYFQKMEESGEQTTYSFGNGLGGIITFKRKRNRLLPNLSVFDRERDLSREGFSNLMMTADGGFLFFSKTGDTLIKTQRLGEIRELIRVFRHF